MKTPRRQILQALLIAAVAASYAIADRCGTASGDNVCKSLCSPVPNDPSPPAGCTAIGWATAYDNATAKGQGTWINYKLTGQCTWSYQCCTDPPVCSTYKETVINQCTHSPQKWYSTGTCKVTT